MSVRPQLSADTHPLTHIATKSWPQPAPRARIPSEMLTGGDLRLTITAKG